MKTGKSNLRRTLISGMLALLLINPGLNTPRSAYSQDLIEYALLAAIIATVSVVAVQGVASDITKWGKESSRLVVLKMMNDAHGRLTAMIDALSSGGSLTNAMRADWEVIQAHLYVVRNKAEDTSDGFTLEDLLVEVTVIDTLSQIAQDIYDNYSEETKTVDSAGRIESPQTGTTVRGTIKISGTFSVNGEKGQIYVNGRPLQSDGASYPIVNFGQFYETGWDTTAVPDGQHLISVGVETTNERQMVFSASLVTVSNAPVRTCGDGICDRLAGEDCQTCSQDCGPC